MAEWQLVTEPDQINTYKLEFWEGLRKSGKQLKCEMLCPKSPERFYLRFFLDDVDDLADIRDVLDQMFDMVDENGNVRPPTKILVKSEHLVLGLPVAVYLEEEKSFFRAVIINILTSDCKCYLVDVGIELHIPLDNICYLPKELLVMECLAVQCKLANAEPPKGQNCYPPDSGDKMLCLAKNEKPLMCKICDVIKPEPADYRTGWRHHRRMLTRLVVELNFPGSQNSLARQANGFAQQLAKFNLCSTMTFPTYSSTVDSSHFDINAPVFIPSPKHCVVATGQSVKNGRGRGRISNLSDIELPPVPLDNTDLAQFRRDNDM